MVKRSKQSHFLILILINSSCNKYYAVQYTYIVVSPSYFVLGHQMYWNYVMKEGKTIFKPLAGIEPHIFGLLVWRVNHHTTRTNHTGNAAS